MLEGVLCGQQLADPALMRIRLNIVRGQEMPKDWKEIDLDEILNFDDAHTGQMARYERIMRQREIEALSNVHAGLLDLKKVIHASSDKLEKRMEVLEEKLEASAQTQSKLQKITLWLTLVIMLATVMYTWITWQTVTVQREANEIQRKIQMKIDAEPSNNSLNPDA